MRLLPRLFAPRPINPKLKSNNDEGSGVADVGGGAETTGEPKKSDDP